MSDKKILIVEDKSIVAEDTKDILESLGYTVVGIVISGAKAVQKTAELHPDLVLMDINLKGEMDGVQAAEEIHADFDIPVIYVTAYADEKTLQRAKVTEPYGYIVKPFKEKELFSVIEMSLYKHATDKRLKESEQWLSITLKSIGDAVITTDNRGLVTFMNPVAQALTGWKQHAYGKALQDVFRIIDGKTRKTALDPVAQVLEENRIVESASNVLLISKTGQEIPIDVRAATIRGDDGDVIGVVLIFRDITERVRTEAVRRQAEEALQKAHSELEIRVQERTEELVETNVRLENQVAERIRAEAEREQLLTQVQAQVRLMQAIMDTVPEGVLLLGSDGHVVLANPTAANDLAVLANATVGDTLTHLGDRPLAELLTSPPGGLWHEVKTDGRTFEVIARPMANDLEPENWVLVVNDVTQEQKAREQLERQERLAAVGQLAAGIAHDFNNIMTIIALYSQMGLKTPGISAKLRDRLEIVGQQAHKATDLIKQILDFARQTVLERRPMDLMPFLKEMGKLLERTMPESIALDLTCERDEYMVNADPTRVQQVVMNLAINARDAMLAKGGGKLGISLSMTAETDEIRCVTCGQVVGESWVCITMMDTGEGIPPDVLPHIFDPFFTTKTPGQGTGLGLAQVYGIVEQHEGHIDVTTKVGAGTTFIVYLPTLLEHQAEATALETPHFAQGHGETILVVEDDDALRKALAGSIELLNYRVLKAANGHEALDILAQHAGEISLVLSDLVMPEMGGQALLHALKQRGLTMPVVILSGHPLENELESLQVQGLAGWMPKPPSLDQLSQLLARVLRGEFETDISRVTQAL